MVLNAIRKIRGSFLNNGRAVKIALLAIFPLFICFMSELNHIHNVKTTFLFFVSNINILLFDYVVVGIFFTILLVIFKRGYIAGFISGFILYFLSWIEYFKYMVSETHFFITDFLMAPNASDIVRFANIKIDALLVISLVLFIVYLFVLFLFRADFVMKKRMRFFSSAAAVVAIASIINSPLLCGQFFAAFNLTPDNPENTFVADQMFEKTNMIAFLLNTYADEVNKNEKPLNYNEEVIKSVLSTDVDVDESETIKPNIIFVMSESFADFRNMKNDGSLDSVFKSYDEVASEGSKARCVVPTYGGYTVKTEFELMFGLPVHSLGDEPIPHSKLENQENPAFARYYKNLGYTTEYIHPFSSSFYMRDKTYDTYGFDKLIFADDFTVPTENYRKYISDETVFNQVKHDIEKSKEPVYIHCTTMQNHQPYSNDENLTEFEYYCEGLKKSSESLKEFTDYLKTIDEPTMVIFMGDHYPLFTGNKELYESFGITGTSYEKAYDMDYVVWNNYGKNIDLTQYSGVSAFYIPSIVTDLAGLPDTKFIETMLNNIAKTPIYSANGADVADDKLLDELTYDRVMGEIYSDKN